MKLNIKRKRGRIQSISFKAETTEEAVDLKTAILAAENKGFSPAAVIDELERLWYGVESSEA